MGFVLSRDLLITGLSFITEFGIESQLGGLFIYKNTIRSQEKAL